MKGSFRNTTAIPSFAATDTPSAKPAVREIADLIPRKSGTKNLERSFSIRRRNSDRPPAPQCMIAYCSHFETAITSHGQETAKAAKGDAPSPIQSALHEFHEHTQLARNLYAAGIIR
jgi:hypothetical protein